MKLNGILQGLFIILIIQSCATKKLTEEGKTAYEAGDYESALNAWEEVIEKTESKGNKADSVIYYKAGMAAMELDELKKARDYLETAEYLEFSSPKLYATLVEINKTVDNLSKEINALESYREKYPDEEKINAMTVRLFETYLESEQWEKATEIWPEIESQAQSDAELLAGYLTVNKNLENDSLCDTLAGQILEIKPNNKTALEWYAKKYFWEAEDLYVEEMKAYKNNRTTSQYDRLLKKLDEAYPTFEKSRDYFLKLYELDPKPEYAKFLGNIYTRLQEEEKAEDFYEKAEE
ncbi:MAG: tetratricopeptide repeat protein [Bacteroidota bacterium]